MEPTEIKAILEQALTLDEIFVKGEGSHFEVIAVSALFENISSVKKQQMIYAPLMEHIATNVIHALTIKALTPAQWARDKKLIQPL